MKSALYSAALGLALLATPALAHNGIEHGGCPADQTFAAGDLTISGAFTRAMLPKAQVAGGYLVIENKGTTPDRLIGGATAAAKVVQIHQMQMDGDMMKMSEVDGGLEIPAGGRAELTPGGYHIMLMGVGTPFKEGECLELTLKFEKAGDVPVVLNVGGTAAASAPEGHDMDGMNHDNMMMAPAQ
jgi:copper(I)-binding protein